MGCRPVEQTVGKCVLVEYQLAPHAKVSPPELATDSWDVLELVRAEVLSEGTELLGKRVPGRKAQSVRRRLRGYFSALSQRARYSARSMGGIEPQLRTCDGIGEASITKSRSEAPGHGKGGIRKSAASKSAEAGRSTTR